MTYQIKRAAQDRMYEVARIFKKCFQSTYPDFPQLHSAEEDLAHFTNVVFKNNTILIAESTDSGSILGFIAYGNEFIDHLYLLPEAQRQGIGAKLLHIAKADFKHLRLWTFQVNIKARTFYRNHGFVETQTTDGSENEEKQPDVLMEWHALDVSSVSVRKEVPSDALKIKQIHDRAFKAEGESQLVNLIRISTAFVPELSLVAEYSAEIIGHALFSKISLTEGGKDLNALSLAPVGVSPEHQNLGIGAKLIEEGIRQARELHFRSILVLGDPKYYGRFGFRHDLVKRIECRYQCEAFAGIELKSDALSTIQKAVAVYPEAFSVVD